MEYQFHNLDVSKSQADLISDYVTDRSFSYHDVLQTAIEGSYKVSFSYNDYHDVTQMSLTSSDKDSLFYGYILTVKNQSVERLFYYLFWFMAEGSEMVNPPGEVNGRYAW